MKIRSLIAGLLIGLLAGLGLSRLFNISSKTGNKPSVQSGPTTATWPWPDSLDAVKAAAPNHRVVYEDNKVRILEVLLKPHEFERIHTHRLPSVMFGASNGDTSAFDIIYYRYKYDAATHRYVVKDSIKQHSPAVKPDESDSGYFMKPEGPHAIKNLSNVTVDAFRVEFKK